MRRTAYLPSSERCGQERSRALTFFQVVAHIHAMQEQHANTLKLRVLVGRSTASRVWGWLPMLCAYLYNGAPSSEQRRVSDTAHRRRRVRACQRTDVPTCLAHLAGVLV